MLTNLLAQKSCIGDEWTGFCGDLLLQGIH